jgi:hypothetical protein
VSYTNKASRGSSASCTVQMRIHQGESLTFTFPFQGPLCCVQRRAYPRLRTLRNRPFGDVSVEETKELERIISLAAFVTISAAMKIAFAGVASEPD